MPWLVLQVREKHQDFLGASCGPYFHLSHETRHGEKANDAKRMENMGVKCWRCTTQ